MALPIGGYSVSSTDVFKASNENDLANRGGAGLRGANVSFANGAGASAKADATASNGPELWWILIAAVAGWVLYKLINR